MNVCGEERVRESEYLKILHTVKNMTGFEEMKHLSLEQLHTVLCELLVKSKVIWMKSLRIKTCGF